MAPSEPAAVASWMAAHRWEDSLDVSYIAGQHPIEQFADDQRLDQFSVNPLAVLTYENEVDIWLSEIGQQFAATPVNVAAVVMNNEFGLDVQDSLLAADKGHPAVDSIEALPGGLSRTNLTVETEISSAGLDLRSDDR